MLKIIRDFVHLFSIIFFLIGAYFLLQGMYFISILAVISLIVILFINSDWAFDNLGFSNHDLVVAIIIFVLIFVNSYFIYNEMKYSYLLNPSTDENRAEYLTYESDLYLKLKPCVDAHNILVRDMNDGKQIDAQQNRVANLTCYNTVENIEKTDVPVGFSGQIKNLATSNKTNLVQIAINLSSFEYSLSASQNSLKIRVNENYDMLLNNSDKIRKIMRINTPIEESKKDLIKF